MSPPARRRVLRPSGDVRAGPGPPNSSHETNLALPNPTHESFLDQVRDATAGLANLPVPHSAANAIELPLLTGPTDTLAGKRLILLAHVDSLRIAARGFRRELAFRKLLAVFSSVAFSCSGHLFVRRWNQWPLSPSDVSTDWSIHEEDSQHGGWHGRPRRPDVDALLAVRVGAVLGIQQPDVAVLASNDRQFCKAWRRVIQSVSSRIQVVRAEFPRNRHPVSSSIITLGHDCLVSPPPRRH